MFAFDFSTVKSHWKYYLLVDAAFIECKADVGDLDPQVWGQNRGHLDPLSVKLRAIKPPVDVSEDIQSVQRHPMKRKEVANYFKLPADAMSSIPER